jgi:hypothetical protein
VVPSERPTILRALGLFGMTPRLDFADAYLAASALEVGPPLVAFFDADIDAITGIRRIAA